MNQKLLPALFDWYTGTTDYTRWWRKYTWVWWLSWGGEARPVLWATTSAQNRQLYTGFGLRSFYNVVAAAAVLAVTQHPKRHVNFYSIRASMPTSVLEKLLAMYVDWLLVEEE